PTTNVATRARSQGAARAAAVAAQAHLPHQERPNAPREGGERPVRRIRTIHLLAAAVLVTALSVPAIAISRSDGTSMLTKIGKGEGSLTLIEWPYYSDKS